MKYDLVQIIKDELKILEKNKMATMVLKKMLIGYPINIGNFKGNTLYFTETKENIVSLELFPNNRIDISQDIYVNETTKNYKTSIIVKDENNFDYQSYLSVPGKEYHILIAFTLSFEGTKIVKANFGIWNYDLKIKDFKEYFGQFLENESLDHTVLGYPSFIKIQEKIHRKLRLFPDYYETHEISSYNDKFIDNHSIDGINKRKILEEINLNDIITITDSSLETFNDSYLMISILRINNLLAEFKESKQDTSEDEKLKNLIDFYVNTLALKDIIRTGWDKEHWNVLKERLESVAEHTFSTMILAQGMHSVFDYRNIDINKVMQMLLIHDLGEKVIGDIPEFDSRKDNKIERELLAFKEIVSSLPNKEEFVALFIEFTEMKTPESIYANLCDKLDCDMNAKNYEDNGYNHLDGQENNHAYNSKEVQEILNSGFNTVADCFIEYDAKHYQVDDNFMKVLRYIQRNNLYKKGNE